MNKKSSTRTSKRIKNLEGILREVQIERDQYLDLYLEACDNAARWQERAENADWQGKR